MIFVIAAGRQRRIRRAFRAAGALDQATARLPGELGLRESLPLRRMVRRGVVRMVDGGKYFLNEAAAAEDLHRRRFVVFLIVDLAVLAFVIWLIYRWTH